MPQSQGPSGPVPAEGRMVPGSGRWSIDGWIVEEASGSLAAPGGVPARLDRSAFEVLRYLLLHAGEICTHDELLAAGWPSRVVSANSVAKCIGRLRRALGDEDGVRLRIVHGYGYRLLGHVSYQPRQPVADPGRDERGVSLGALVPYRPEWRVVERLGIGGSGEVFATVDATRASSRAYKFARGAQGLRALKREVALHQYLAAEHAGLDGVLPLVDWNLEQSPCFVATPRMAGGNLAQWAAGPGGLATMGREARLQLAIAICDAVAGLHAADVAHRDLKPETIYPERGADGVLRVRIGDLGAGAGLLPPGVDALGLPLGQATRAGIDADPADAHPERYHAPEVLAGEVATSRADVYALAVITFQVLANDFRRALTPGWEDVLGDPLLCRDLARAAHQDPVRRLGSAAQWAHRLRTLEARRADLERRARIEAERDAARHREQTLKRRLRVAAVVSLSAFVALWISLASVQRVGDAQREAERQARDAAAVRDFMTDALLGEADPYRSGTEAASLLAMLDRAADEVDTRFAEDPASAAAVYLALGSALEGHGQYARSIDYSRRAVSALQRITPADPMRLADALLAECRQARLAGRIDAAVAACGRALQASPRAQAAPALALRVEMAKLMYEQGRCTEAVLNLDALIGAAGWDAPDPQAGDLHAREDALWFRGLCHAQLGRFPSANADFERLLSVQARTRDPQDLMVAWAHMDYAETLVIAGDFTRAAQHLAIAESMFAARLGPGHVDSQLGRYQRARIALWSGDAAAAVPQYRQVLDLWERERGPTHAWTLYTRLEWLWARAAAGEIDAVRAALPAAREAALAALGARQNQRAFFAETWARIALLVDDRALARQEIERARQDSRATVPDDHPRHAVLDCLAADLAHREGDGARRLLAACEAGLAALAPDNYRRRWAAEVATRIEDRVAAR
jgi:DNA-binding winged helix-turn-helix (wHTH) protein/tetratricopeptide (TPR) repeat protein